MGYGPRATKMDDYIEGRVRKSKALARSKRDMARGLRRQTTTSRVVLGKITLIVTDDVEHLYTNPQL